MRKCILIFISIFLFCYSFGQTVGKVGGADKDAISKIGSVSTTSIAKIGDVNAPAYYKNCKEILAGNPGSPDGVYTIDPDGSGPIEPFNCFCDMTTDGGGWTMVGYYRHPTTENAPADLDNRDYAYFMKARNDQAYGKPEYIANPDSEGAWTDWRVLAGVSWPIEFANILDQTTYATWGQENNAKVIYRVKNRNIMPNYGTSQDLTTSDNLYYKNNFSFGWSDVGSSSNSETYYWYPRNSANKILSAFIVSNNFYNGGTPSNYHYATFFGSGLVSGDDTWHHSARMFIR